MGLVPPTTRIDYARELNDQQLAVVEAGTGPLLVIAGAGSGKTRTLTYRVARLIESGVDPGSILLLTFTNKSAREMLGRVESILGPDAGRVWGGTFHHMGHVTLRRQSERIGIDRNFSILDREDARHLMSDVVEQLGLREEADDIPKADVICEIGSFAANTERTVFETIEREWNYLSRAAEEIDQAVNRYRARKRELACVDFDDLLILWATLLQDHEEVRSWYGERFHHVLVDEYQDTNAIQGRIVDLLVEKRRNLMVVGDDSQSIYAFRGANYANIFQFPKRYPDSKMFKLEWNYRSTPEVLALANSSISNNAMQFEKTLKAYRPSGAPPKLIEPDDAASQARMVTRLLEEHHSRGVPWREMAVLYRSHFHALELQMELTGRGVPYAVRGGPRFFEQAHLKDSMAFLRVVDNPRDELSWRRLLKLYPKVGDGTAGKVFALLTSKGDPLAAAMNDAIAKELPKPARAFWPQLSSLLRTLAMPSFRERPGESVRTVLDSDYSTYLEETYPNARSRKEDLRQFAEYARRYESTRELLQQVALLTDLRGDQPESGDGEGTVVLSTIHQAKGLEWQVVFVIWLVEGRFPTANAVKETETLQEERRLFYVAATRAKDALYLFAPQAASDNRWDVVQRNSRFVEELDPSLFERVRGGAF